MYSYQIRKLLWIIINNFYLNKTINLHTYVIYGYDFVYDPVNVITMDFHVIVTHLNCYLKDIPTNPIFILFLVSFSFCYFLHISWNLMKLKIIFIKIKIILQRNLFLNIKLIIYLLHHKYETYEIEYVYHK